MIYSLLKYQLTLLLTAIACSQTATALAVEVRSGLSQRETYVGLPVVLQIQVKNAQKIEPPTIPTIDGLSVKSLGTPSRSTNVSMYNGQIVSSTSTTFAFELTPERVGTFRLPPIKVSVDGSDEKTRELEFVASKSDTGDLMFVEIAGKQKQIFVGQALDVTLQIYLRPFHDREHKITLSEGDMWQLISDRTNWGLFADRMEQLAKSDQRPVGREVLRKDSSGVEHSYYLYQVDATIYPKRPGKIDSSGVKVVVQYPTAIGKQRDPFAGMLDDSPLAGQMQQMFNDDMPSPLGPRLAIKSVRPIVAEAHAEAIDVLPIPSADRPADYRGAVGKYLVATEANPTSVKAGDPIELLIGISGTGPMDLVQAPPLAEIPQLAADFKVPNEPLAGFVKGDRKMFSTSIRPRRAGITQIPSIPFSYFDPTQQKFVTVQSTPITVHVDQADTLALDSIVGKQSGSGSSNSGPSAVQPSTNGPSLAIYTGDGLLKSESPAAINMRALAVAFVLPPMLVIGAVLLRAFRSGQRWSFGFGSRTRRVQERIERATNTAEIAAALQPALSRQLRIGGLASTAEIAGELRRRGQRQLAVRCERIFDSCAEESLIRATSAAESLSGLKCESAQLLDDLRAEIQNERPKPVKPSPVSGRRSLRSTSGPRIAKALAIAAIALALVESSGQNLRAAETRVTVDSQSVTLTLDQQQTLLREANDNYTKALQVSTQDMATAKSLFTNAAEKYELVVQSGVTNGQLYCNLANAYLQNGATGKAIANYRRALKFDPTNSAARTNLAFAEKRLAATSSGSKPDNTNASSGSDFATVMNGVRGIVSPTFLQATAVLAWAALWLAVGLRCLKYSVPWKTVTTVSFVLFACAATMIYADWQQGGKSVAVVTAPKAELYSADDTKAGRVSNGAIGEGTTVEPLKRRGDWLQIRTEAGATGWLPATEVEVI